MAKVLVATIIATAVLVAAAHALVMDHTAKFESFKREYGREYESAEEEGKRFDIFVENMKRAEKLNAQNPHAHFGVNAFADMSAEEFKPRHSAEKVAAKLAEKRAKRMPVASTSTKELLNATLSVVDWRQRGAVTSIKDQGQCGSCWSFSTTGGVEGQWFLAGNALTSLSEQELVSCDITNLGCRGGWIDDAYEWVLEERQGTFVTEASYPYVSASGVSPQCQSNRGRFGAKIIGHRDLEQDEDSMANWVAAYGPMSIIVDATGWQTYSSGIMTNCPAGQIDHAVLIVGFDGSFQPPYWIIKNSWGTRWGEEGYLRLEKNTNQCNIVSHPRTSVVSKSPGPGPRPGPPSPRRQDVLVRHCKSVGCNEGCNTKKIPLNTCYAFHGKYQIVTACTTEATVLTYSTSNCQGSHTEQFMYDNMCMYDELTKKYVEYSCA